MLHAERGRAQRGAPHRRGVRTRQGGRQGRRGARREAAGPPHRRSCPADDRRSPEMRTPPEGFGRRSSAGKNEWLVSEPTRPSLTTSAVTPYVERSIARLTPA